MAAYINEAGLDGMAWLRCKDRVESLAYVAMAKNIHETRAERQKKLEEESKK